MNEESRASNVTWTHETSVLQCVAVCCSVLQCVAVLQCDSDIRDSFHDRRLVCCSVLQCVAVCCSVLQCVAVLQCDSDIRDSFHDRSQQGFLPLKRIDTYVHTEI